MTTLNLKPELRVVLPGPGRLVLGVGSVHYQSRCGSPGTVTAMCQCDRDLQWPTAVLATTSSSCRSGYPSPIVQSPSTGFRTLLCIRVYGTSLNFACVCAIVALRVGLLLVLGTQASTSHVSTATKLVSDDSKASQSCQGPT